VTKIPEEHHAARALEESFRALGAQRARRRRRRPAWGWGRIVVAALTSVFVVAGVATGTKVFLGDGGMLRSDAGDVGSLHGRIDPDPTYRQLAQATAADPHERARWGMRMFKSRTGETCLVLGRVVDGRLGVVRQGQFKRLPTRATGMCAPLEAEHVVLATRTYYDTPERRSVLYGAVDRTVSEAHILAVTGRTTPVAIAPDGTFLVVRSGANPFHLAHLVVDGSAGRHVQLLAE